MIAGRDSAFPPSLSSLQLAAAAGVRVWGGYIATSGAGGSAFNLYHVWTQADFDLVRRVLGTPPLAFCSGWDDPVALSALAKAWGVRLCLDVEGGIRGDGPWVDSWLAAAPDCGLYGNPPVHYHQAPFHIVAAYYGFDPRATWHGTRPPTPCGWQWQGTHDEFGVSCDSMWLDDWFATGTGASGSPISHSSYGDHSMAMAVNPRTGDTELFLLGEDGQLYQVHYTGVFGPPGAATLVNAPATPLGFFPVPGTVSASWSTDGNWLRVVAAAAKPEADGKQYYHVNEYNASAPTTIQGVHVTGKVWRTAPWYDWATLQPIASTVAQAGTQVTYNEARIGSDGRWYDRIVKPDGSPGDWALADEDVDTGGNDPTHYGTPASRWSGWTRLGQLWTAPKVFSVPAAPDPRLIERLAALERKLAAAAKDLS